MKCNNPSFVLYHTIFIELEFLVKTVAFLLKHFFLNLSHSFDQLIDHDYLYYFVMILRYK